MNHVDVLKYIISSIDERNQKIKCLKYNLKREGNMNITNQIDGRVLNKRLETIKREDDFSTNGGVL